MNEAKGEASVAVVRRQLNIISMSPVYEPYAYTAIAIDPATKKMNYVVIEPTLLDNEKRILARIKEALMDELDVDLKSLADIKSAEKYLRDAVERIVKKYKIKLPYPETLNKLLYYAIRDFVGYGKIDAFMRDHMVEDISCDGVGIPIYVWHREYESLPTNVVFESDEELNSFVIRLAYRCGKHVSIAQPILDAALPDGSRVNITYSREVSRRGSSFTIRRFRSDPLTISDLIMFNTLSAEMAAYYWMLIEHKLSLIVAGGTATGKTTLLNCLAMFIKPDYKIITVEDTAELNIPHENWLSMVTRTGWATGVAEVTIFDLLKTALRQRPDYVVVGEVRGAEAYTLFHAMATGHGGLCSIHADSVQAVIHRLESEPMNIPRSLLTLLDDVILLKRVQVGGKPVRRIAVNTEIVALDPKTKEILTSDTYTWNPHGDTYTFSGRSYVLEKIVKMSNLSLDEVREELARRRLVLEWMVRKGIRSFKEVGAVVKEYYADPAKTYRRARMDLT